MCYKIHNIICFILFSISCCYSQQQVKSSFVNGLTTTQFNTDLGKITIYLPEHHINEQISGSIVIEPNGNSENKKTKNNSKLKEYQLNFGEHIIGLHSLNYTVTTSQLTNTTLNLLDDKKKIVATTKIPIVSEKQKNKPTFIPAYITAGNPAKIIVANTGNINNSAVLINDTNINLLAASEAYVFFETPANLKGKVQLYYQNDTTNIDDEVNVLQINITAEKLNLSRTETTKLNITVVGLEGLEEDVPLTITNNSPSNISLEGGNNQEIIIHPNGDTYQITQTIRATQNGGFSISASVLPSDNTDNLTNNSPLCNCIINNYSYLINPSVCEELGGNCYDNTSPLNAIQIATQEETFPDFYLKHAVYFSYDSDIEDLEDEIFGKWKEYDDARNKKEEYEELRNDLIGIDKILDSVPNAYKDALKRIVDSLQTLKKELPDNVDNSNLQNTIDEAQAAVNACEKRKADLIKEQKELEEQLEKDKEDLIKSLEYLKNILRDYNIKLDYKFNEDGSLSYTKDTSGMYEYDKEKIENENEFIGDLEKELRAKHKQHKKTLKRLKEIPQQLAEAEKDCEDLTEALEKAKQAKATSDLAAATALKAENICDEIQRLLARLKYWCKQNPEHCDFLNDIEIMMERCPKTPEELDDFWSDFDALLKKKKALEDSFDKAAQDAQSDMDDIEDDVSDLENDIASIAEEKRKKDQEDQERKQNTAKAEAEEAAKAKAAADERKKQRNKQKKEDDKVKDLIKKAKSSEAGDDAFENLLTGTGLSLLDEVSGNSKLGSIIGGLLAAKDVPDCTCPIIKALRDAIAARNRKENATLSSYVDAYLLEWSKCANLPSISSVPIGSTELTNAIKGMSDAQVTKALDALNQAIRIQCN